MEFTRGSGILLHPTCLPGAWGIGDLGPEAHRFVNFLSAAGQTWWQILPLEPTGYGNSPYMCFSALAGNHLLISPEKLVEDELLAPADVKQPPAFPDDHVQYRQVIEFKRALFGKSFDLFKSSASSPHHEAFMAFREKHASWLEDYALFVALKEAHRGQAWTRWEPELVTREPQALQDKSRQLRDAMDFHRYLQYLFFRQWAALREYCHRKGVRIFGDLPIYIAHDSAEVWSHREIFYMDDRGHPSVVPGVPPDYFSATGQRWAIRSTGGMFWPRQIINGGSNGSEPTSRLRTCSA